MLNYNFAVATAELQNNKNHIQNFRMWFKFGLKAQKLLAQGIALGIIAISKAPCKGKSFVYCQVFESFCPYRACLLYTSDAADDRDSV